MSLLKSTKLKNLLAVAAIGVSLASCSSNNPLEVTRSHCPAVAVVGDVGSMTRLNGDLQRAEDVVFTATIVNIDTSCTESDQSGVNSLVTFEVAALSGPALTGSSVDVEYFAVILKDNSQIVTKKRYPLTLSFNSDGRAVVSQSLTQLIPSLSQARRYDYELLLGFQMTASEIAFNMEQER